MNLDTILTNLTSITGHAVKVSRCEQALTNAVYRVTGRQQSWALRINNPEANKLGIDRHREQIIVDSIRGQRWSPNIIQQHKNYLFSQWCDGLPFRLNANSDLDMLAELLLSIQQTQLISDCQPLKIDQQIDNLIAQTEQLSTELENAIRSKLADYHPPRKLVLCHHDWHPGNILLNDNFLTVLDWEYAALGDRAIELACVCEGFNLTPSQQQYLLNALDVPKDRFTLAQCLTNAMSLLWYLVRFPNNNWRDKQQDWLERWAR